MNLHPSFNHHLSPRARKARIDAIMKDKPITLPFLKDKPSLWQRIKNKLNK